MALMIIFGLEEDKKALCQLLGKLHLPDQIDDYKLRCLKVLMHNLNSVSHYFIDCLHGLI